VIDGEIVAIDEHGCPSFQALQHRGAHRKHEIVFYAFDVLHLNGRDVTPQALTVRRAKLPSLLEGTEIKISQTLPGRAADVVAAVRAIGERSNDWVKLKLEHQQVRGTCDCRVRILAAALKSFCRVRGRLNFG
jgi:ATP-dependent DNA ligase